jgi:hypothetical protein
VWVTVRGEDYIDVLDGKTFEEKTRIKTPNRPGMQIFSPDGKYGYITYVPDAVPEGPGMQIVQSNAKEEKRYLVIAEGTAGQPGAVVQVEEAG